MVSSPGIDAAAERSAAVRDAFAMARQAHSGQIRNASRGRPYIEHPVAVAEALRDLDCSEEVLAAALLHDVVEESEIEVENLRERFGERIADLVDALTDDAELEPYELRKREHRAQVQAAGPDALVIYAADKLANVTMLRSAYELQGEGVSEELKVSLDERVAIWEQDLEMLRNAGGDPRIAELASGLSAQLTGLREDRAATARPSAD